MEIQKILPRILPFFLFVIVAGLFFITTTTAKAASLTWDPSGTAGVQDGTGSWDTSSSLWTSNGGTSNTTWVGGSDAIFGGGSSGTAGTVSLSTPESANSITFNTPFAGNYTISASTLTLTGSAAITLNSTATSTISSVIAGSNGLTVSGAGQLVLSGINTYTGGTTLTSGTVIPGSYGAFSSSTVTLSGVTLGINSPLAGGIDNPLIAAPGSTSTIIYDYNGGGNVFDGNTFSTTTPLTGSGALMLSAVAQPSSSNFNNIPYIDFLSPSYTGTVSIDTSINRFFPSFANANYSNTRFIVNGQLGVNTTGGSSPQSWLFAQNCGTCTNQFGELSGNGTIASDNSTGAVTTWQIGALNTNSTFSGTIRDNLTFGTGKAALTKVGTGTLTLSGPNTYTGATTVSGGELQVNGSLAATAVTANGGKLSGTGMITGTVTVANAATSSIQGGTGTGNTGVLTTGALTFSGSSSQLNVNTNTSTTSMVVSTGAVTLGGATVNVTGALPAGTYGLISGSSISGSASLGINSTGHAASLATTTTSLNLVVTNTSSISLSDPNVFYSPYNWVATSATSTYTSYPGAYFKAGFTGTTFQMAMAPQTVASNFVKLAYSIDGGTTQHYQTAATSTLINFTPTPLSSGTHTIQVWVDEIGFTDRWVTPQDQLNITGFYVDSGSTSASPNLHPLTMVVYGDSITEGWNQLCNTPGSTCNQWIGTWDNLVANSLNAEIGTIAFAGQGYEATGNGNAIGVISGSAWNHINANVTRNFASAAPNIVYIQHGQNGTTAQSDVTSFISDIRGQLPNACIFVGTPFSGTAEATIKAAFNSQSDPKTYLIDPAGTIGGFSSSYGTTDGLHPSSAGHQTIANALIPIIDNILLPSIPTITSVTPGDGQVGLAWSTATSSCSSLLNYKVEYSSNGGLNWTTFAHATSTTASINVTSLTDNTSYEFRISAMNDIGTGTSSAATSSTPAVTAAPTVTASAASSVGATNATLNGNISSIGGASVTVRGFAYGLTTVYGATTTQSGSFGTGVFSATVSGLSASTPYHFIAYATNSGGTSYSTDQTFTTGVTNQSNPISVSGVGVPTAGGGPITPVVPIPQQLITQTPVPVSTTSVCSGASCPPLPTSTSPKSFTSPAAVLPFVGNLSYGTQSSWVKSLQQYLNSQGFSVSTTGAGSVGHETDYFGLATRSALSKFQKAHGISPASGYFGPLTRAYIQAHS